MPGIAIQTPKPVAQGGLRDQVIWLTRNFRFADDSGIGQLAADINSGDNLLGPGWRANATIGGAPLKGAPARVTILVIPAS